MKWKIVTKNVFHKLGGFASKFKNIEMLDVKKIKKDFSLFNGNKTLSYLDNAASSQTPDVVVDAMNDYYYNYRANINRGLYDISNIASTRYEQARESVAVFIGSKMEEVIFTDGATTAFNMLIYSLEQSLKWNSGDEIVTTIAEHHSTLIPLQEFAKRNNLVLKHIPITETYNLDYGKANELITNKTRLVVVSHASNVLGTIYDVKRLSKIAHTVGAYMVVDAAKTVGHIKVNVADIDCDFLYFSGHKMCGPTGIGVLYGKTEALKKLKPSMFGGGTVEDVSTHDMRLVDAPICFEPGTRNIAGAIGLSAAISYIEKLGLQKIHKHISGVLEYAVEKMQNIKGVTLLSQSDVENNIGIVSFTLNGVHTHDIADILNRDNVAVRSGHHCAQPLMKYLDVTGVVRASFYFYNDKNDVDKLIQGILEVKKIFL